MFQTMSEGIIMFHKGLITFSNDAFKQIIKNIQFEDNEAEVDIFDYKLFSIYNQDEDQLRKKKPKKGKKVQI